MTQPKDIDPASENIYATVICTTYNTPHFLELVLDSLASQTYKNFELVIADDGSTEETKRVIEKAKKDLPLLLEHVWHEDNGFRKAKIQNEAIKIAKHELLIFIDGDCVVAPGFIEDHINIYKQYRNNYLMMGRKAVELNKEITEKLTADNYKEKLFGLLPSELFLSYISGKTEKFFRRYSIKNRILRKLLKADNVKDLLGANFSTPKDVVLAVNGFDENVVRVEDGDLFVRIRNLGVKLVGKKYFAEMYHLYHDDRGDVTIGNQRHEEKLKNMEIKWTPSGLIKSAKRPGS